MHARRLAVATALAVFLAACGDDDDNGGGGFTYVDDGRLTVMTRNLYLGADLDPVLLATDQPSFIAAANGVLQSVTTTNDFRKRAGALASEIAAARPDLVGLQEVSLWRTQTPGDGTATPASTVAFDFLTIPLAELSARGLPYAVAEELPLFDVEVPVPITTTTVTDVRLTDRQVILAISGLPTSSPRSAEFTNLLPIEPFGATTTLFVKRGWTAVNATVGGQQFAFFNTHLEAFLPAPRIAQAGELVAVLDADPLSTVAQVLVGDLNSQPGTEGHLAVTDAGFTDLWADQNPGDVGFTCCFDPDLTVSTATLDQRIDYVLWRGSLAPTAGSPPTIVGEDPADRTGTPPLWPSDHAGVVGTFDP